MLTNCLKKYINLEQVWLGFLKHGLRGDQFDDSGITRLDELGIGFEALTGMTGKKIRKEGVRSKNKLNLSAKIERWSAKKESLKKYVHKCKNHSTLLPDEY